MNTTLAIITEDDAYMAIYKPSGITVNRSDTTRSEETVQDFVEKHLGLHPYHSTIPVPEGSFKSPEETFKERSGIVHRLDKETSGILLVAKTLPAFIALQQQFKERIVKKTYLALAHGKIQPAVGEVSVPVGRLEFNRKRFGVVAGGRDSLTRYTVLETYIHPKTHEPLSLVELHPETGRTHQIRVHLKHLNRPIFADELYAGRKTARDDRRQLARLFLHAAKISFLHPVTHQEVMLESALPEDLALFIATLTPSVAK